MKKYEVKHALCDLKVGDKVRISRKADTFEEGWGAVWRPEMDTCVGKTGHIMLDGESFGFRVSEGGEGYLFPYFVLEKVED